MIDRRRILALLMRDFSRDAPTESWSPDEISLFERARAAFVSAGARAVDELSDFEQSHQVAIEVEEANVFLAGDLRTRLIEWHAARLFERFFFMRKPPGIRLRFFGSDLRALRETLHAHLDVLRKSEVITGYRTSIYEGETYQFGGDEGLSLMHEHATYDSLWALEMLRRSESVERFFLPSALALNHLIRQVTLDVWEAWDVWENMRLADRVIDDELDLEDRAMLEEDAERQRELLRATFEAPEEIVERLDADDQAAMRAYFVENEAWARRYEAVAAGGNLLYGIRKILPFYAVFHWNRLGLSFEDQCTLAFQMRRALNPKRSPQ